MITPSIKPPARAKGAYGDWTPGIVGVYEPSFSDANFISSTKSTGALRTDIQGIESDFMPILREVIAIGDLARPAEVLTAITKVQLEVRKLRNDQEADAQMVDHCLTVLVEGGAQIADAAKGISLIVKEAGERKNQQEIVDAAEKALARL